MAHPGAVTAALQEAAALADAAVVSTRVQPVRQAAVSRSTEWAACRRVLQLPPDRARPRGWTERFRCSGRRGGMVQIFGPRRIGQRAAGGCRRRWSSVPGRVRGRYRRWGTESADGLFAPFGRPVPADRRVIAIIRALPPPRPKSLTSDSSPRGLDPALVAPPRALPKRTHSPAWTLTWTVPTAFAAGRLMLTDRRLLARDPGAARLAGLAARQGLNLQHTDHGGVGQLECTTKRRLALWRYTLAPTRPRSPSSDPVRAASADVPDPHPACPRPTTRRPRQDECPTLRRAQPPSPPATWVLLRLSALSRPYRWQLLLGFALMLADGRAAGAALPHHPADGRGADPLPERQAIDPAGGMLLAACSAPRWWPGAWAGAHLHAGAGVRERIGADLRTTTFEHLLQPVASTTSAASAPAT